MREKWKKITFQPLPLATWKVASREASIIPDMFTIYKKKSYWCYRQKYKCDFFKKDIYDLGGVFNLL